MLNPTRAIPRDALLSAAIAIRSELQFRYHGADRVAHPHSLGATSDGTLVVIGWQMAGRPGDPPGWRLYSVEKMNRLARTGRRFDPLPAPPHKLSGLIRTHYEDTGLPDEETDIRNVLPPLATEQRRSRSRGRYLRAV
ncbi:hypothetical protein PIGHUM_01383 [Pigmentiphaga humi]|uniref:WYL domain-containing protein n=1 Tax=Pigmentiphaga humi TaxID=2478468 RepID=A0A3P4AZW4_9BURK|nr:hypothetical protein [Pigmentiphaga humi]VCU69322.1 hypothetical protein PIGHUM_01383 [Pigmentiphaga humi]